MDKTDFLLFTGLEKGGENRVFLNVLIRSNSPGSSSLVLSRQWAELSLSLLKRSVIPETTSAAGARCASSGALWLRATRREGELIFPFTRL